MTQYDDTNSGVIFSSWPDTRLVGQGKINLEGTEHKAMLVEEKLSAQGDPVKVLYVRAGVLFENDPAKMQERSPKYSGPCDFLPTHKIAGWPGSKQQQDGSIKHFLSLKASLKQGGAQNGGGYGGQQNGYGGGGQDWGGAGPADDDIPF